MARRGKSVRVSISVKWSVFSAGALFVSGDWRKQMDQVNQSAERQIYNEDWEAAERHKEEQPAER